MQMDENRQLVAAHDLAHPVHWGAAAPHSRATWRPPKLSAWELSPALNSHTKFLMGKKDDDSG